MSCCCINLRGCSGEPNRLIRSYHSGQIEDLQSVVDHLRTRYPNRSIALIGFSLGGNLILRWLGEQPDLRNLLCAITISATMDLKATLRRLDRWPSVYYQRYLTRLLLNTTSHKAKQLGSGLSPNSFHGVRGFAAFDDVYTAPLNGFVHADEYYRWASARSTLKRIELPTTWLVNAYDDPFMGPDGLPTSRELSPMDKSPLFSTRRTCGFSGKAPVGFERRDGPPHTSGFVSAIVHNFRESSLSSRYYQDITGQGFSSQRDANA